MFLLLGEGSFIIMGKAWGESSSVCGGSFPCAPPPSPWIDPCMIMYCWASGNEKEEYSCLVFLLGNKKFDTLVK